MCFAALQLLFSFLDHFKRSVDLESEFAGLRLSILQSLDSIPTQGLTPNAPSEEEDVGQRPAVHNLINLLLRGEMAAEQQLVCIRVLASVFDDSNASPRRLLNRKIALTRMGTCVLVLRMIACSTNDQLFHAGLQLGSELLRGGECVGIAVVQDALHSTLTKGGASGSSSIISAMDGSVRLPVSTCCLSALSLAIAPISRFLTAPILILYMEARIHFIVSLS